MKVELTEKLEITDPILSIRIALETEEVDISLEYRCPNCAGWGCRSHGGSGGNPKCVNGTIYNHLSPQDIIKKLGPEFKSVIDSLYKEITT